MPRWPALFFLLAIPLWPAHAAEPSDADYRQVNRAIIEGHVIPRYAALREAAAGLDAASAAFCAAPAEHPMGDLVAAEQAAVDAWQAIQHVRFGPVEFLMRGMRLSFWPDPRNTGDRDIADILANGLPEDFGRTSVAVQGFPALERLLHPADARRALLARDEEARRRCGLLRAITGNVAAMAGEMLSEWQSGLVFDSHDEAPDLTRELFKAFHQAVEIVADHKLALPLGKTLADARPDRAEAARSGRSMAAIRRNIAAGQAMYEGEAGKGLAALVVASGDTALDALMRRAFKQTLATADSIKVPLRQAVADPTQRPGLEKLSRETKALKQLIAQRVSAAIGIPVGFNALDGD